LTPTLCFQNPGDNPAPPHGGGVGVGHGGVGVGHGGVGVGHGSHGGDGSQPLAKTPTISRDRNATVATLIINFLISSFLLILLVSHVLKTFVT
jgi:hypothetical protein